MPSVLSPNNPVSRSYAPLADETNPSIATSAPTKTVPHNGSVIYGQPSFPPMVAASSSVRLNDLQKAGMSMRNDSEETLSPSASRKGKERAKTLTFDEGALGEVKRASYTGKERVRDIEEGRIYSEEQLASENSRYPPTNEAEEEERRIQENLTKLAARDMARRRAARESKQLPTPSTASTSPRSSYSISSAARRPFSFFSTSSKKGSLLGLDNSWIGKKDTDVGELPMSRPRSQGEQYMNPYEAQPTFSPAPKASDSPTTSMRSPFADPSPPLPAAADPSAYRRASIVSAVSSGSPHTAYRSPLISPSSPTDETGFAYGGPTWRGGQAVQQRENVERRGPDRWWHALCAWGDDLDGGHDVPEAGRTNPFE
ncbi:hypothetical protein CNBB2640 [Cryptococcus deneoformans B-3501A]|uniref:Expressed protein n=1 Tax=Cryptococcus deneoformans (strain JEC21 / ATCC MYA-565) TaxID=214684 RepID=Q5KM43_CRYD1|nr:expressed protein [Cryptococcus neoformans var. neoformans JEC21]XP_777279.1 hypothetical protein CNBB2640 [Cryptococcus neoformans var. neoformans B-3501A]AAW41712.1 expressed protein [Cryptococcus neoformans var. neoformans JEC21]EAL22632.1 hypothetical protein CNBB2640 [Cryptococcus neoformans var. neoformans B-3501A]